MLATALNSSGAAVGTDANTLGYIARMRATRTCLEEFNLCRSSASLWCITKESIHRKYFCAESPLCRRRRCRISRFSATTTAPCWTRRSTFRCRSSAANNAATIGATACAIEASVRPAVITSSISMPTTCCSRTRWKKSPKKSADRRGCLIASDSHSTATTSSFSRFRCGAW